MEKYFEKLRDALERGRRFVTHDVWQIGMPGEEVPHGLIIKQVRAVILLVQSIGQEMLLLRASALTFATLLFIVPFLAFMFYFIQTFNLGDQVYRAMWEQMDARLDSIITIARDESPEETPEDGEASEEAAALSEEEKADAIRKNNERLQQRIMATLFPIFSPESGLTPDDQEKNPVHFLMQLAEQSTRDPQALGITGVLFVLSTVFGFMRNVESSFNSIWGVRKTRNLFRAVSEYMMVTLLLPFVAAGLLGLTAAMESDFIGDLLGPLSIVLRGGQFFIITLTLSLLYYAIPNTRVRYRYALLGAVIASALWLLTSWGYIKFQFGLVRYTLFFSTFALFPLLLMWIFLSWLILLFGALVSYAYQNEHTFALERHADKASFVYREAVAIRFMTEITRRFLEKEAALSVIEAATAWSVPTRLLNEVLSRLTEAGLVSECMPDPEDNDAPTAWRPACTPQKIQVIDILRVLRKDGQDPSRFLQDSAWRPVFEALNEADPDLMNANLEELARDMSQRGGAGPEAPELSAEDAPESA
jgi:membrane protein